MTQSVRQHRRWYYAAVAAVGALIATFGLTAPASAAPVIDPGAKGTLVVHKRLNPTASPLPEGNGLENPDAPGTPLDGVQFTIQQLTDIDLTEQDGWSAANAAIALLPTPPTPLGEASSQTTSQTTKGAGTAVFTDLPVGAYYVTETLTSAQIAAGITPAAPFIVTIPITHPTNREAWLYETHVYPKNLQTTPVKQVDDGPGTTYEIGDQIRWTISAQVPAQPTDFYAFKDELSEHLSISAPTAGNVVVKIGEAALEAADYEVFYPATAADLESLGAPAGTVVAGNTLFVSLTDSGLEKLKQVAGTAAQVAVTLTTTVHSLPTNGVIANQGAVFPNAGFPIVGPGVVTPSVGSKFGEITIDKTDSARTDKKLEGAEFKVFASEADALAYANNPDDNEDLPLQAYQNGMNNGALTETFVTDIEGRVSISGLRASNWQDGVELTASNTFQNYWLLETKAPGGYELLTAPFGPVSVLYNSAEPTVLPVGTAAITNVEKLDLPLTGGTLATWLIFLAGGLILVSGTVLVIRTRARNAQA